MKKILLSQIIFLMAVLAFAQEKTATSFNIPFDGTVSTNQYGGVDDGSGIGWYTDNKNVTTLAWNNELQVSLNGTGQWQGWGSYTYDAGDGVDSINISSNPKLSFKIKSDADISFQVQLQGSGGKTTSAYSFSVTGNNTYQTVTVDFTSLMNTLDFTKTRAVRFQTTDAASSYTANIAIDDLMLGTSVVAGVKPASLITTSSLYPNPSKGTANIKFSLKESANVKVMISDAVGKEMAVVLNQTIPSGETNTSFDVSGYEKGLYYVNYFINGSPSKAQLLVVE